MVVLLLFQLHEVWSVQCIMLTQSTWVTWRAKSRKLQIAETAVEAARKKEATQTAKNIEIARKKTEDLTNQLHEVEQQERMQSQEQDIAQHLINEAASRLSTAVKTGYMQAVGLKVTQIMLDSGNDKPNEAMKQQATSQVDESTGYT